MGSKIFVSYSHRDGGLVGPIVALLRASEALVFRDAEDIRPGKKWRDELTNAMLESRIVLLFWCRHAMASEEVKREYESAIEQGKDVIPILLDDAPLPSKLAEFQHIDFRSAFPGNHSEESTDLAEPVKTAYRSRLTIGALLAFIAAATIVYLKTMGRSIPSDDPHTSTFWWVVGIVFVVVAGLLYLFSYRTLQIETHNRHTGTGVGFTGEQARLARTISAELRSRLGASEA